MTISSAYKMGAVDALYVYKLAAGPSSSAVTNPTEAQSAVRGSRAPQAVSPNPAASPPSTPKGLSETFNASEQVKTIGNPRAKLLRTASEMCTSCRREKHYGSCDKPRAIKRANFNVKMKGDGAPDGETPSTSPHYHSATSDSSLARARDGRPAGDQASSGFADLYRHLGVSNAADEPGRMYGGLHKVASYRPMAVTKQSALGPSALRWFVEQLGPEEGINFVDKHVYRDNGQNFKRGVPVNRTPPQPKEIVPHLAPSPKIIVDPSLRTASWRRGKPQLKLADFMLPGSEGHSMHEQRGPSVNPYEERRTRMSAPAGWGDEGDQRTRRAFDQIDSAVDTTNIGGGFGDPEPGPAALG